MSIAAIYGGIMDLVEEGFVNEEEARRMVIPTLGRSRQEFMAPFGLNGIFSGLALEEIEVFSGEDHIGQNSRTTLILWRSALARLLFLVLRLGQRSPLDWTLEKVALLNSCVAWRLA
jgi:hypothetical protein